MIIKKQLLAELSAFNIHYIADALGTNPGHFKTLIQYILTEVNPIPPRAAWVAELITQKDPDLIRPYLETLINSLDEFSHPGTRRNILKILQRTEIPEKYHGILIDQCFQWIMDESEKVATKVYAMQIIENHLPEYPELAIELSEVIQDQYPKNSAGFKSRGKKVLKNLKQYL